MRSRISFFIIFVSLFSCLFLLLLLHHSLLAAQCQYNLVETLALLPPSLVGGEPWSNVSSCRSITFHQGQEVFMTDLFKDCVLKLDLKNGEIEAIGTECDDMNEEGWLLVDQMGGVMVELEEEDKIAMYSGDGLLVCK